MPSHNNRRAAPPRTHRHGVVNSVVVDTGAQWITQHASFKQLQRFCHFLMEVIRRFIRTCKVEIVWVQPVNKTNGYLLPPGMWNLDIWVTMEIYKQLYGLIWFIKTQPFLSPPPDPPGPTTPAESHFLPPWTPSPIPGPPALLAPDKPPVVSVVSFFFLVLSRRLRPWLFSQ